MPRGSLAFVTASGITNPDSGLAEKQYLRHPGLNDYRRLIPSLTPRRRGDEREAHRNRQTGQMALGRPLLQNPRAGAGND